MPDTGPYVYDQRSLPFVEDRVRDMVDRAIERGYFTWNKSPMHGEIAPGFGSSGGGRQTELPLTVSLLEALGVLKEITP